jgi:hypothetical protein
MLLEDDDRDVRFFAEKTETALKNTFRVWLHNLKFDTLLHNLKLEAVGYKKH